MIRSIFLECLMLFFLQNLYVTSTIPTSEIYCTVHAKKDYNFEGKKTQSLILYYKKWCVYMQNLEHFPKDIGVYSSKPLQINDKVHMIIILNIYLHYLPWENH